MFNWKNGTGFGARCISCSILASFCFIGITNACPEETKSRDNPSLERGKEAAPKEGGLSAGESAEPSTDRTPEEDDLEWRELTWPDFARLVRDAFDRLIAGTSPGSWAGVGTPPESPEFVHARSSRVVRGDFGGDLALLKRYHLRPQKPDESNHYIDLWSGHTLSVLAQVNGLTNNNALFVDSHGKAGCTSEGSGYGFYPHTALLEAGQPTPYYSARDLARVLGPEEARKIHNVVLAGCNAEGRFRSAEVRRHFPNATNITYMAPGELAFKPMYYQAIVLPAADIRPLYSRAHRTNEGRIEAPICTTPSAGTRALGAYVADLYLPGASKPYRTVPASRELLDGANFRASPVRQAQGGLLPQAQGEAPSPKNED